MSDDPEYLEALWDCPSRADHKGQSGTKYSCQSCGTPRPENVVFYLPEDAAVITDEKIIAQAKAGSDLICDSCGSSVLAGQTSCPQCAAPLDENLRHRMEADAPAPLAAMPQEPEPIADKPKVLPWAVIGSSLVAAICLGWWLFVPHQTSLRLTQVSWERVISLQEERTVHEEDWSVPSGGRTTGNYSAVHHYVDVKVGEKDVQCHPSGHREKVGVTHKKCHSSHRVPSGSHQVTTTRNLGNGKFERSSRTVTDYRDAPCTHDCPEDKYETFRCTHTCKQDITQPTPIYQSKYRYDIERWFDISSQVANGINNEPQWPSPTLDAKHRESGRQEKLVATFVDPKGKTITISPQSAYWLSLHPGMQCTAMVSRAGIVSGLPICKELQ